MVEIIIKTSLVTGRIAEKLKNIAVCAPEGSCIPVALANGDFTFDIAEDSKTYWDSLNEPQQRSILRRYVEGNKGFEDIMKEGMNEP